MNFLRVFSAISVLIVCVSCHDDDVHTVQYTTDTFSEEVPKKNHFVMFYAPWCGHCQRLSPTWEQLAEMLNEDTSNIRIAKVDCTTDNKICLDQDVTGYPTLKFFKVDESEGVKFKGMRDLPSLTAFINEQLSTESEQVVKVNERVSRLIELTEDDFEKHVSSGKHFIKFYAPWCGHCQKLAPVWEELAQNLDDSLEVDVAKIDCTQHRTICNQFDIKGYPTLLWIEDGKKVEKYQGSRTQDDLQKFVLKMIGSSSKQAVKEDEPTETTGNVIELNGSTFDARIKKYQLAIVQFYAPWCGHCKRLAPTWEDLGKLYAEDEQVSVVKVDCSADENKSLCTDQDIEGFPTIFIYEDGEKVGEFDGNRELKELNAFVSKYRKKHDEL